MSAIFNYRMQQRANTLAGWNTANPILASGEIAFVIDQNKIKIGDGVKSFNALPYITDNLATDSISEKTAGAGIMVDGVLLKDKDVVARQIYSQSTLPFVEFDVQTSGVTTFGKMRLQAGDDYFILQSRDNNDNHVANDIYIDRNANGATRYQFRIANSTKLELLSNGDTRAYGSIHVDNGISFNNGTNTLEYYEEGAFTPTLYGTTTAGSPTYVAQEGSYIRIGNICYVTFRVTWSSLGGATGSMRIGGLPFTITAGHQNRPVAIPTYYHSLSLPSGMSLTGYGVNNTSYIRLQLATNVTTSGTVTEAHLTETGELYFNMTYMV